MVRPELIVPQHKQKSMGKHNKLKKHFAQYIKMQKKRKPQALRFLLETVPIYNLIGG